MASRSSSDTANHFGAAIKARKKQAQGYMQRSKAPQVAQEAKASQSDLA